MKVYRTDKIITRDKVRANPDVLYLFGDNDIRKGLGGQAKEMRGEPNTIGISTKKLPSNTENSFKTDDEYDRNIGIIAFDILKVLDSIHNKKYHTLVIPPIGTGLAKLPEKAPRTYEFLLDRLNDIERIAKSVDYE